MDGQRSSHHAPDKSAAAIHQQENIQLGLKLVGMEMLLITKSWQQIFLIPKMLLSFEEVLIQGSRPATLSLPRTLVTQAP